MRAVLGWPAFTLLVAAACYTPPPAPPATPVPDTMPSMAAGTRCDPADYDARSVPDRSAIDSAFAEEPRMEEMRVVVHAPRQVVREKVTAAMLACNIPIAQSSDDVIEARYGAETGLFGQYDLITHVYVVALNDSTTLVRLSGQETSKTGKVLNPTVNTRPISNKNHGRSGNAWVQLRNVAKQLRADPALHVDFPASTHLNLVYAK